MKRWIFLLAVLVTSLTANAQNKMVIGSKTPDLKSVEWLNTRPQAGKPTLIEFHNPANSSSAQFLSKLEEIKQKHGNRIEVIVIIPKNADPEKTGFKNYTAFPAGHDREGKIYQGFNVQYLPYTVLIDSKGELFWQGNLRNITNEILNNVK